MGLLDFTSILPGEAHYNNRLSMGFLGRTIQPDLVDLEEESDLDPGTLQPDLVDLEEESDLVDLELDEESDVDPVESFSPMKGGIQVIIL